MPIFAMTGKKSDFFYSRYIHVHLCFLGLSAVHSSNIGAHFLIDMYKHKMISVPVQGIWDGVTLSTRVGTWTDTLKNPTKCLWRWEPDCRSNFFTPPAHSMCNPNYLLIDHAIKLLKYISMRKLKATYNSEQFQIIYESYFRLV